MFKTNCIALFTIVLCGFAASARPQPAGGRRRHARRHLRPGCSRSTRPDKTFPTLVNLRAQIIRVNLDWNQTSPPRSGPSTRPTRPIPRTTGIAYDAPGPERGQEQDPGAVHDLRHAALGERQEEGPQPRAEADAVPEATSPPLRPSATAARSSATTTSSCRPCASGWPGTSRTTRSSSRRSGRRSNKNRCTPQVAAKVYAGICTRSGRASTRRTSRKEVVACGATDPRGNNAAEEPRGRRSRRWRSSRR